MKKILFYLSIAVLAPMSQAHASHTSLNVGINVGVRWCRVCCCTSGCCDATGICRSTELGFYVAVGVPYDLFFYGNRYYLSRGNMCTRLNITMDHG